MKANGCTENMLLGYVAKQNVNIRAMVINDE